MNKKIITYIYVWTVLCAPFLNLIYYNNLTILLFLSFHNFESECPKCTLIKLTFLILCVPDKIMT